MVRIRVAEVFAALPLTTDVAAGVAFEKGLRTCVVATAFGLDEADRPALWRAGARPRSPSSSPSSVP